MKVIKNIEQFKIDYYAKVDTILRSRGYSKEERNKIYYKTDFKNRLDSIPDYYLHYHPEDAVAEMLEFIVDDAICV